MSTATVAQKQEFVRLQSEVLAEIRRMIDERVLDARCGLISVMAELEKTGAWAEYLRWRIYTKAGTKKNMYDANRVWVKAAWNAVVSAAAGAPAVEDAGGASAGAGIYVCLNLVVGRVNGRDGGVCGCSRCGRCSDRVSDHGRRGHRCRYFRACKSCS